MKTVREALKTGNMASVRFEAHALKGSSAQLGADRLSDAAFVVEKVSAGKEQGDLDSLVTRLEKELNAVKEFAKTIQ